MYVLDGQKFVDTWALCHPFPNSVGSTKWDCIECPFAVALQVPFTELRSLNMFQRDSVHKVRFTKTWFADSGVEELEYPPPQNFSPGISV